MDNENIVVTDIIEETPVEETVEESAENTEASDATPQVRVPAKPIRIGDKDVLVKQYLPVQETMDFVNLVTSLVFIGDNEEYHPELKDFAIKRATVLHYSNLELPMDLNECYIYLCAEHDDVVQKIVRMTNQKQYKDIVNAVDQKIEFLANSKVAALTQELERMMNQFDSLQTTLASTFENIDNETLTKIAQAVSGDGVFDERELVRAVIAEKAQQDDKVVKMPPTEK